MQNRCIVVGGLAPTRPYKVNALLVFADGAFFMGVIMADKEFNNTLNAVEKIISTCIFNIANELNDLSDNEKLQIYSEIEQLAMDAIQDAKQMGALH